MLKFNEIIFKSAFCNKVLLSGIINMVDEELIDMKYLSILYKEPIGFEKDKLKLDNIIALYEEPSGKNILYSLEYKDSKDSIKLLDSINNDYIFLAKLRSIISYKDIGALNLKIKIINIINYVEYKDNICIHNLKQYKSEFYIIELPKANELNNSILRDFLNVFNVEKINDNLNRSDIVGELARVIEKENENPRIIRELKQLEEMKSRLTIKYQTGYHKGKKDGYDNGYAAGKNQAINDIVLALNKERISKHRIAKIVNLSELEVKGIIDNNKKTTFSLNN